MGMDRCVQVCLGKRGCVLYRDYVVLERHHDIAPQVGVSMGIMPNGARILDQLALFDAVESKIEPCDKSFICYPDGFGFTSAFPSILHEQYRSHHSLRAGLQYLTDFLTKATGLGTLYPFSTDRSSLRYFTTA